MVDTDVLFKISYGLYIVTAGIKDGGSGFISNTVFQVSSKPRRFAACCHKENFTCNFIEIHNAFAVSVLSTVISPQLFGRFGFRSGREINKFEGLELIYGESGMPVVIDGTVAWIECRVIQKVDVGTHMLFVGDLIGAHMLNGNSEPMTYEYYRQVRKGHSPSRAPTFIENGAHGESETGIVR